MSDCSQQKIDGIVLTAPFTSLVSLARQKIGLFKVFPNMAFPKEHLDSLAVLRRQHAPLLIVHGSLDSVIPVSESEKLFAAASEPKTFVRLPNADHNDISETSGDAYVAALKAFFDKLNG